jgi:hypothetical protein
MHRPRSRKDANGAPTRRAVRTKSSKNPADQQPDGAVPLPVPNPEPVVAELFRLDELPVVAPEPELGDCDPDMPRVAPPVALVPQGRPLAPIRPVLLEFRVLLLCVPGVGGLLEVVELPAVLGFDVAGFVALGFIVL